RSELVVCVHTVLAESSVATRGGSANSVRAVGVGTTDRSAAMLYLLVLVDEGNIQRFDRLIGAAEDEVLVSKVGIDVSTQFRIVIARERLPLAVEVIRQPGRGADGLVVDRTHQGRVYDCRC